MLRLPEEIGFVRGEQIDGDAQFIAFAGEEIEVVCIALLGIMLDALGEPACNQRLLRFGHVDACDVVDQLSELNEFLVCDGHFAHFSSYAAKAEPTSS
jgi:hypothetical protein